MGFMDDSFNSDEARYNRQNRINPPEFAPGQEPMSDLFSNNISSGSGESFGGSGTFSGGAFDLGSSSGDMFGGGVFGGSGGLNTPLNNNLNQQMNQQPTTTGEEKLYETIEKGTAGIFNAGKDILNGCKGLTPLFWSRCGFNIVKASIACIAIGVVSKLFGLKSGLEIAIGGCLSAATGIIMWLCLSEKARKFSSEYADENNTRQNFNPPPEPEPTPSFEPVNDFGGNSWETESLNEDWGSDSEDDDEDDFDISSDDDDDDDIWNIGSSDEADSGMTTEDALSSLPEVPIGMYTRQYLYDAFMKRLPKMNPNFSEMREVDEDDDLFIATEEKLQEAASVAGCREDFLPELLLLEENLFVIRITCDRPTGFKPDNVAVELANIYAYDRGTFNPSVYAKADAVGSKCVITLFKGASAMISTKDMILQVEDFFLNSDNYMPVVLGTDQLGNVIHADFKKVESVLITGMPRSGKSWFVQNVLTQMCALTSPSELNIYICDPKDGISDFKSFCLPHVKKFVSGDDNIVNTLRKVVKEEAPDRKSVV